LRGTPKTKILAGHHLENNGFTNFLILEAQDYVGGRIKQVKFGNVTVGEGGGTGFIMWKRGTIIHSWALPTK
jgi:monoamine oxidase